jgi:hypothetical protein
MIQNHVIKATCGVLSNIAAAESADIIFNAAPPNRLPLSLATLALDSPWKIKKEAMYALFNIAISASPDKIVILVSDCGLVDVLEAVLGMLNESELLVLGLTVIQELLELNEKSLGPGEKRKKYLRYDQLIEEQGIVDALDTDAFVNHRNDDIYNLSSAILTRFFGFETGWVDGSNENDTDGSSTEFASENCIRFDNPPNCATDSIKPVPLVSVEPTGRKTAAYAFSMMPTSTTSYVPSPRSSGKACASTFKDDTTLSPSTTKQPTNPSPLSCSKKRPGPLLECTRNAE